MPRILAASIGPCPAAPEIAVSAFPDWLVPMAARLTQDRFEGPEWSFERKLDGIRLLAFKNGSDVRLLSRTRLPLGYPSVARAVGRLPVRSAAWPR